MDIWAYQFILKLAGVAGSAGAMLGIQGAWLMRKLDMLALGVAENT